MGVLSRWDRWNQSVTDWHMDHPERADRWYDPYATSPVAGVVLGLVALATWAVSRVGGLLAGLVVAAAAAVLTWRLRAHPGVHRYRRGDRWRTPPTEDGDAEEGAR